MGNGARSSVESDRLGELVVAVLERLDADGLGALEDACRDHPTLADGLRRRIATLAELGLVASTHPGRPPERIGDFRLIERIGAGGMGVVYRAVQESLGREVALKLIRPDSLHLSGARERFARETAIVARLQHPGIVPIHMVGEDEELPYYAMELVPGCTLAEALVELSGESPSALTGADLWRAVVRRFGAEGSASEGGEPGPLFEGSWEETCLRVIGHVADALGHAHDRGVLHRDVKPSNVMITPGGRVMLLDFGLSNTEGDDTLTRSSDRIGSLPFMAPELFRGGPGALDRTSDVYAMGVTLYQLLTLRLPFDAGSMPETIARIVDGRPPRPRAYHPGLSWECETVCLAAMDCDPARRYATADALARDISNVLHRRPIEARRASFALRARRWIQRRPGAAAAIFFVTLLPVVAAFFLARETRNVNAALGLAVEEGARAQRSRDVSLRAIDSMLHRLAEEDLDHIPGMFAIRAEILAEAATLYEELLLMRPGDVNATLRAARCEHLTAVLHLKQAEYVEADAQGRRALERLEPWAEAGSRELRLLRARCLDTRSVALRSLNRRAEATAFKADSVAVYRALLAEDPGDDELQSLLMTSLADEVYAGRASGERAGAEPMLEETVALFEELARGRGDDGSRALLATNLARLGAWRYQEGRTADSVAPFEQALELRRALLERMPEDEELRAAVAASASNLAGAFIRMKDYEAALGYLDLAVLEIEVVIAGFPDIADYLYCTADVYLNRGAALAGLERIGEAIESLERAAELLRGLRSRHPGDPAFTRTLGTVLVNLGSKLVDIGQLERALDTFVEARDHFEQAHRAAPRHADWRVWLAIERICRAKVLLALGRPDEAADGLVPAPEFAAHRLDIAKKVVLRLGVCLEQAWSSDDEERRARCEAAAREVILALLARGDMGDDPTLDKLRTALDGL